MISIDRESSVPVQTQVADQLRYMVATGQYQIGVRLPSTRRLAGQLGVSYHTVRAAYGVLEDEGLIEGRAGSGYRVRERAAGAPGERMEAGAAVFQEALRRLVGMGLEADDIEYLFQEQLEDVVGGQEERMLVFAAPALELAELCAAQLSNAFQQQVYAAAIDDMRRHLDADFVFASFRDVRRIMVWSPGVDVRGVGVHLNGEALERIVRLRDEDTLGVITRHDEAVPPLVTAIRSEAAYSGQMLAFSTDADPRQLGQLIEQATLVVYTPPSRRMLLPFLKKEGPHLPIHPVVSRESVEVIRVTVPR